MHDRLKRHIAACAKPAQGLGMSDSPRHSSDILGQCRLLRGRDRTRLDQANGAGLGLEGWKCRLHGRGTIHTGLCIAINRQSSGHDKLGIVALPDQVKVAHAAPAHEQFAACQCSSLDSIQPVRIVVIRQRQELTDAQPKFCIFDHGIGGIIEPVAKNRFLAAYRATPEDVVAPALPRRWILQEETAFEHGRNNRKSSSSGEAS